MVMPALEVRRQLPIEWISASTALTDMISIIFAWVGLALIAIACQWYTMSSSVCATREVVLTVSR